jgi:hypothetical protein
MNFTRLMIVIPVYAAVAIFLPQMESLRGVFDALYRIDPDIAFGISVAGLILGLGLVFLINNKLPMRILAQKPRLWSIVNTMAIGVIIAAVFDVFEKMSGQATNIVSLLLIPIAFGFAEAVYQAIIWRVNNDPMASKDERDNT